MVTTLLLLSCLAQPIYEWTDAQGETHYTNTPDAVPKGVKVRTTEGRELSVVSGGEAPQPAPATTPAPASRPARPTDAGPAVDTCAAARQRVAAVEAKLAGTKADAARAVAEAEERCQALLATHGQGAFATCMARRPSGSVEAKVKPLEQELDAAREALRRAQVSGCR